MLVLLVLVFALLDFLWVFMNLKLKYGIYVGAIERLNINIYVMLCGWICLVISELLFLKYIHENSTANLNIIAVGSALGFLIYFAFNLTILHVCKSWKVSTAIGDVLWGIFYITLMAVAIRYFYPKHNSLANYDFDIIHPASIVP